MIDKLQYPTIMKPGELNALNEFAISKLGTPIFFATPDLAHPNAQDKVGRLYEIVTALYMIYHDYGTKLFETFLWFCKKDVRSDTSVISHYKGIGNLRGGLCHGSLPKGSHAEKFIHEMEYYLGHTEAWMWPDVLRDMTEDQCGVIIGKLSNDSDKLVNYLKSCAEQIAENGDTLQRWRRTLIDKVLNKDEPLYGGSRYFDGRIINDLANLEEYRRTEKQLDQMTVKVWLTELEPKILDGKIGDPDELRKTLADAIYDFYCPSPMDARPSSDLLSEFD